MQRTDKKPIDIVFDAIQLIAKELRQAATTDAQQQCYSLKSGVKFDVKGGIRFPYLANDKTKKKITDKDAMKMAANSPFPAYCKFYLQDILGTKEAPTSFVAVIMQLEEKLNERKSKIGTEEAQAAMHFLKVLKFRTVPSHECAIHIQEKMKSQHRTIVHLDYKHEKFFKAFMAGQTKISAEIADIKELESLIKEMNEEIQRSDALIKAGKSEQVDSAEYTQLTENYEKLLELRGKKDVYLQYQQQSQQAVIGAVHAVQSYLALAASLAKKDTQEAKVTLLQAREALSKQLLAFGFIGQCLDCSGMIGGIKPKSPSDRKRDLGDNDMDSLNAIFDYAKRIVHEMNAPTNAILNDYNIATAAITAGNIAAAPSSKAFQSANTLASSKSSASSSSSSANSTPRTSPSSSADSTPRTSSSSSTVVIGPKPERKAPKPPSIHSQQPLPSSSSTPLASSPSSSSLSAVPSSLPSSSSPSSSSLSAAPSSLGVLGSATVGRQAPPVRPSTSNRPDVVKEVKEAKEKEEAKRKTQIKELEVKIKGLESERDALQETCNKAKVKFTNAIHNYIVLLAEIDKEDEVKRIKAQEEQSLTAQAAKAGSAIGGFLTMVFDPDVYDENEEKAKEAAEKMKEEEEKNARYKESALSDKRDATQELESANSAVKEVDDQIKTLQAQLTALISSTPQATSTVVSTATPLQPQQQPQPQSSTASTSTPSATPPTTSVPTTSSISPLGSSKRQ